jgi:hypothetical protein
MSRQDEMRETWQADNAGTTFYVELTDEQALDIASGYVPAAVKAMVITMLDWRRIDEVRAARPVKQQRARK